MTSSPKAFDPECFRGSALACLDEVENVLSAFLFFNGGFEMKSFSPGIKRFGIFQYPVGCLGCEGRNAIMMFRQPFCQIGSMTNVKPIQLLAVNNISDEHRVLVEHIGVEPMTSSPKAFGACSALASFNEQRI